ncbi:MAG: tetratricopeptide repeat protein [Planctomycetota bacterium]
MFKRWEWKVLVIIVLTGFFLRWVYLREIVETPDFRHPFVDAVYHDYWARSILSGDKVALPDDAHDLDPRIGDHPYVRPPGYPYFLALIYALSGSSPLAVRVVQMLLGLVNGLLVYGLCRPLYGRGTALVSAALMNLYWIFIYYEGKLHAPVLLIFLSLCLFHLCRGLLGRPSFMRACAAGGVLGVFALVRPNILLFAPVIFLWAWWYIRKQGPGRRFRMVALGLATGLLAAIAPVTIRNYVRSGDGVLISANAGVNLYIGNNPAADGTFVHGIPYLESFGTCFDYPAIVDNLEKKTGHSMSYSEVSRFFADQAFRFIKGHPGDFLRLVFRKLVLFFGPHEIKHNNEVALDREFSKTLSRIPGSFGMVFSLAIVGGVLLWLHLAGKASLPGMESDSKGETRALSVLIFLYIVTYSFSFLLFFVTALYRVPVIPFLIILGSVGAWAMAGYAWKRRFVPFMICLVALAGVYLILTVPVSGSAPESDARSLARWHFARGLAFTTSGIPESAAAEYREALQADPGHADSLCNLAALLKDQEKTEEAASLYQAALAANPGLAEALCGYAHLCANQGRFDEAIAYYERALRVRPVYIEARFNLANALYTQAKLDEAVRQYTEVLRLKPDYARAHCNLGVALARQQRFDEAIRHYGAATRIDPDYAIAYVNLGIAYTHQERFQEAIKSYRRALELNPDDDATRKRLAGLLKSMERE